MKKTKKIILFGLSILLANTLSAEDDVVAENLFKPESAEVENDGIENAEIDSLTVDPVDESLSFGESMEEKNANIEESWTFKSSEESVSAVPTSYSDQHYIDNLAKLPNVMDMTYNNIVRSYIDMYTNKKRQLSEQILGLSEYYFPLFEDILAAEGIPDELKYLPVIESALNPNAMSRVGACGLWQFMYSTGKLYGLEANSLVDDRKDPIKATYAATRFLKDMYKIYNDWTLVIAAYNCGPGNVNKAIYRSGGKRDYWSIYYYLPRETRGYVPAFIAANYMIHYYKEHNLNPLKAELPMATDTIVINKKMHLEQVSGVLGIPIELLRSLNPQYRVGIVPGHIKPYALKLPIEETQKFIEMQDSIYKYKADELVNKAVVVNPAGYGGGVPGSGNKIYYRIKSGDNLGSIAARYHVSVSDLRRWNGLYNNNIVAGKTLVIYTRGSGSTTSVPIKKENLSKTSDGKYYIYKVRSGDNLWTISKKMGVDYETIKKINNIVNIKTLQVGQSLKIPVK